MADNIVIILCPECNTKFRFALPEKRLAKPNKKMKMRCLVCASQFSVRPKDLLGPTENPVETQIRVQSSLHGMKTTKSWDTIRDWIQQGILRGSDPISVFGAEWRDAADCSEVSDLFSSANSSEISADITHKMSEEIEDSYEQQKPSSESLQEESEQEEIQQEEIQQEQNLQDEVEKKESEQEEIQQEETQQEEIQQEKIYPSSVEVEFDQESFEQEEIQQEEIQQEEIQQEEIQQEEIQQEEIQQEDFRSSMEHDFGEDFGADFTDDFDHDFEDNIDVNSRNEVRTVAPMDAAAFLSGFSIDLDNMNQEGSAEDSPEAQVTFSEESFEQEEIQQEEIQQEEIQQEEIQQENFFGAVPEETNLDQEITQHQSFEEDNVAEDDLFYDSQTIKDMPVSDNLDNDIQDENIGQDQTNNEIDADFDEFDSEEFQSTIFGDLQSIEDNLLKGTMDSSKTIVNENFSASLFSDIGQEEEDDGFFRLSDGFEKSGFSTDDPFGVLGSEEEQVFPSAVNMELDIEESAPIGAMDEDGADELPEDNDEELDKPEFFEEEEPAKSENIWSEEVEDEYSFDVQAYLSGVRSNSNSWEDGNDAFEDIDNFQSSGFKKNLRVIGAVLAVLVLCIYFGYSLFSDTTPTVSAINPEIAKNTFIEEQEVPAEKEDVTPGTEELEKQPELEKIPDNNQLALQDADKKTPEQPEPVQEEMKLQLTPQPEQDFFAGLDQDQKAPSQGWNDKEEVLTIGSDLQNISREGWVAVHNRESMRAESLFRSVLQQNPNHVFALYGLGYVLEMRSNEATQLKENAQAANYKSKSTQVYCRLLQSKPDARTVSEVQGRVLNMGMSCIN